MFKHFNKVNVTLLNFKNFKEHQINGSAILSLFQNIKTKNVEKKMT